MCPNTQNKHNTPRVKGDLGKGLYCPQLDKDRCFSVKVKMKYYRLKVQHCSDDTQHNSCVCIAFDRAIKYTFFIMILKLVLILFSFDMNLKYINNIHKKII